MMATFVVLDRKGANHQSVESMRRLIRRKVAPTGQGTHAPKHKREYRAIRHHVGKSECNETVLQESPRFSQQGRTVQYSDRVWGTHETNRLIKMCLNETCVRKHPSDNLRTEIDLKQGDAPFPLFFYFAFEYDIRKAQENQVELKMNETHQLLI
jgi:hypothetical protein